ncbi:hypothetical protein BOTCAL_0452g00020 [Botryotinia calthae]|uniref:Uncharacterized protein n=1 Tax=Botryotinia calthae TaxID=38488 RepID=A0A4Y8CPR6_9HELO|nr:hypothetical protein BOTCAL_0452g00020 [Botryotinia calthae]
MDEQRTTGLRTAEYVLTIPVTEEGHAIVNVNVNVNVCCCSPIAPKEKLLASIIYHLSDSTSDHSLPLSGALVNLIT